MSLDRMATQTANIKRETMTNGIGGNLEIKIVGVRCVPLIAADTQIRQRLDIQGPIVLWHTYVMGLPDIRSGDVLSLNGKDYQVKTAPERLDYRHIQAMHLILEEPVK